MRNMLEVVYREAVEADDRFHESLVRQFGVSGAPDARYDSLGWDEETRRLAKEKQEADEKRRYCLDLVRSGKIRCD